MPSQKSDARKATKDLIDDIRGVFRRYTRSTRRKSWDALMSPGGKSVVNKLINDPKAPVTGIPRLLRFKEWLDHSQDHRQCDNDNYRQ